MHENDTRRQCHACSLGMRRDCSDEDEGSMIDLPDKALTWRISFNGFDHESGRQIESEQGQVLRVPQLRLLEVACSKGGFCLRGEFLEALSRAVLFGSRSSLAISKRTNDD